MSSHPATRAYVERRTKEGKSKKEIIRCLKRYVAREVYRHLRDRLLIPSSFPGRPGRSDRLPRQRCWPLIRSAWPAPGTLARPRWPRKKQRACPRPLKSSHRVFFFFKKSFPKRRATP